MKIRYIVSLSILAGIAPSGLAVQGLHAQDKYIRNIPLDAWTLPGPVPVPAPVIPPGSTLDLRPNSTPNATDRPNDYGSRTQGETTPSIGLSIKAPIDNGK